MRVIDFLKIGIYRSYVRHTMRAIPNGGDISVIPPIIVVLLRHKCGLNVY